MLGLRPGELLALTWTNVDLDEAKMRVTQSLIQEAGQQSLGDTKTAASRRVLLMPAPVVTVLRAHLTAQASERRSAPGSATGTRTNCATAQPRSSPLPACRWR